MTDPKEVTPHPENQPPAPPQPGSAPAQTPVSDPGVKEDGSGKHGRPSDNSDPGHS